MPAIVAPSPDHIQTAADGLRDGHVVAVPTETVYGLGADAANDRAVASVYRLKDRPSFNPLILHFLSMDQMTSWVHLTPLAYRLGGYFWPGPLTLVLDLIKPRFNLALGGLQTAAVRIPSHPVIRDVLKAFGGPIAAPSANKSERLSPTTAQHVLKCFAGADQPSMILDGGPCRHGLESTILDARGAVPILLRLGSLSIETVQTVCPTIKVPEDFANPSAIQSPGQMRRHYAPRIPLRLDAHWVAPHEALLAFGPGPHPVGSFCTRNLSERGDVTEGASNLFAFLHDLEESGARGIAVTPIPGVGLGAAILDRLRRGALSTP